MKKADRPQIADGPFFVLGLLLGLGHHVCRAHALSAPGIGLGVEGDLLALVEGFIAVCNNRGEMHKNIVAAVIRINLQSSMNE